MNKDRTMTTRKAGRELDNLVAENVMGWTACGVWDAYERTADGAHVRCEPQPDSSYVGCPPNAARDFWDGKRTSTMEPVPSYSTDASAAWGVVERMVKDGWACEIWNAGGDGDQGIWWCRFGVYKAEADTMPMAVSLAALQTAETQKPPA